MWSLRSFSSLLEVNTRSLPLARQTGLGKPRSKTASNREDCRFSTTDEAFTVRGWAITNSFSQSTTPERRSTSRGAPITRYFGFQRWYFEFLEWYFAFGKWYFDFLKWYFQFWQWYLPFRRQATGYREKKTFFQRRDLSRRH